MEGWPVHVGTGESLIDIDIGHGLVLGIKEGQALILLGGDRQTFRDLMLG